MLEGEADAFVLCVPLVTVSHPYRVVPMFLQVNRARRNRKAQGGLVEVK